MKIKRITTEEGLEHYRKCTHKLIDVLLPMKYLINNVVVGCYDETNKLCGGFAIILNGPFRVLDSIPNEQRDSIYFNLKDACEITGLWLNNKMIKKNHSLKFWMKLYFELLRSKRKHICYAYSLRKPKLGKLYSNANPTVLFRGETKLLTGMDFKEEESVEMIPWKNLLIAPLLSPRFILKRLRGLRVSGAPCYRANSASRYAFGTRETMISGTK